MDLHNILRLLNYNNMSRICSIMLMLITMNFIIESFLKTFLTTDVSLFAEFPRLTPSVEVEMVTLASPS